MSTVEGVTGPIETGDLGFTLMHEHIMIANWSMRQAFADWVDSEAVIERAVAELSEVKALGVSTVVDLTPINIGRDIHVIREVAFRSGMQIIAATGLYYTEEPWLEGWPAEKLVEWLIRDLTEGIQGTDSRSGIIKCATNHSGVTPLNEKLLIVAAQLHRASGAPISTHTAVENRSGLSQQDVFEQQGVDLSRVVIGHCGDSADLEYLEAILERGSTIGMDRFGLDMVLPTKDRVATIAALAERGRARQMVLSHDACCHIDFFPGSAGALAAVAPNWNFRHVPQDVVPALRKVGVSDADIHAMTVENPRRIFEAQGVY